MDLTHWRSGDLTVISYVSILGPHCLTLLTYRNDNLKTSITLLSITRTKLS